MKIFKALIAFMTTSTESFSWIGIANRDSTSQQSICDSSSLSFIQRRICKMNSEFEPALNRAAKHSMKICSKSAFGIENGTWSQEECSNDISKLPFMSSKLKKATPESAFLHGLSSGQLITSVYKLCQSGSISTTNCDINRVSNFVTEFTSIMSIVKRKKSVGQIEIHNSKIGRGLAWKTQKNLCKCHGTSGSCLAKTCWETAPLAEHLGELAIQKYSESIGIKMPKQNSNLPKEITNILAKDDFLFIRN